MNKQHDPPLFGLLLRKYRDAARLNQVQLQELLSEKIAEMRANDPHAFFAVPAREDISRFENGKRLPERNATIRAIAHVLADALDARGFDVHADDLYLELLRAKEPQVDTSTINPHAVVIDRLIKLLPEAERESRWEVIYSWIDAEYQAYLKREEREGVTKFRHIGDSGMS